MQSETRAQHTKRTQDRKGDSSFGYIIPTVMLLLAVLIAAAIPTEADAAIYDDTVRLHILANSDSDEDQELKLHIRDKLLERYGALLAEAEDIEEAKATAEALLPQMREDAENWIREAGFDYECEVTLTEEWYDTREYDGFTLPKGRYTSLRVLIGDAEGHNWWCVMFPALCLDIATEDAPSDDALLGYSDAEIRLIGGGYTVKFRLLELIGGYFGT